MIRGVLRKGDANDFRDMIMNPRDRSLFIDSMCDYWYSSPRATISVATSRVKISSISNLNLMICPSTFSPMKLSRILSIPPVLRTTTSNPKTITVQVEKEIHIKTPPYFVILDHEYERVVLLVRGTFSANDFVTDLAGHKYKWKEGNAHQVCCCSAQEWSLSRA